MALNKAPRTYFIEPMTAADIDEVVDIERASFRSAWAREVFVEELNRDLARIDIVRADDGGPIAAFANYWLVSDEVHLLNLATHPLERRQGHACRLLTHLIEFARRENCHCITLEVRRSNSEAIRVYRRFAFRAIGVRPNYYADEHEDAIVMLMELT